MSKFVSEHTHAPVHRLDGVVADPDGSRRPRRCQMNDGAVVEGRKKPPSPSGQLHVPAVAPMTSAPRAAARLLAFAGMDDGKWSM